MLDTGRYREGIESGRADWRAMFTAFDGDGVVWPDGEREHVDAVIFATGYRPNVDYLAPLHVDGISTTHPGLVYLGLEFQRSFSSNTLRGVSRDADHVAGPLAAHVWQARPPPRIRLCTGPALRENGGALGAVPDLPRRGR